MTWDVTISDMLANSHLARTSLVASLVAGAAAEAAALLKIRKYDDLLPEVIILGMKFRCILLSK